MANGWSLLIGLLFIVVFSAVSWFASPKGDNQTVWRSTLILSAWSCYLMWAITFLAQWHPLIAPKRSDLRPEFVHHEGPRFF
ncbi:H(+)-transporting V0 sector ATPase subunit e [Zalaria obscura]|uniref:H(+)-transporting V0 sector ATPase subunit e n=1 Tax=Zalaria obscura TaxID=2024903 RepID=A0ACC3SEP0_9PEZI